MQLIVLAVTIATVINRSVAIRIGCVLEEDAEHCFEDSDINVLTWQEAWTYCSASGGQLAAPKSNATADLLGVYLKQKHEKSGLSEEVSRWIAAAESNDSTWRMSKSQRPFNGNCSQTLFAPPGNQFDNCGTFAFVPDFGALFMSTLCKNSLAYACQSEVSRENCENEKGIWFEKLCIVKHEEPANWFEAVGNCKTRNSTLVQFEPESFCRGNISVFGTMGKHWWGIARFPWVWVEADNGIKVYSGIDYYPWLDKQPISGNGDCVTYVASTNFTGWKTDSCDRKRSYICQKSKIFLTTTPITVTNFPTTLTTTTTNTTTILTTTTNTTAGSSQQNQSPYVTYLLPSVLMILSFVLLVVLLAGCVINKRRTQGYSDIKN